MTCSYAGPRRTDPAQAMVSKASGGDEVGEFSLVGVPSTPTVKYRNDTGFFLHQSGRSIELNTPLRTLHVQHVHVHVAS